MLGIERIEKISAMDIKAILMNDEVLVTGGREGRLRVCLNACEDGAEPTIFEGVPGCGYINCIAIRDDCLFAGCQNGKIAIYNMNFDLCMNGERSMEPVGYIDGHGMNVCTLDAFDELLMSGSWDCTVAVWDVSHCKYANPECLVRIQHPAAVWSAKFVRKNMCVTGCADNILRIYEDGVLVSMFEYHVSCVRSLAVFDGCVFSIDNEGIVLKMTLDGVLLKHQSLNEFGYCLSLCAVDGEEMVVCCGENGKVMFFDMDLRTLQDVRVPVISCWTVCGNRGKVYVGCNDGRIYMYSKEVSEDARKKLAEIEEGMKVVGGDREFVSNGQKFKTVGGEVYQEVDGEWVFMGSMQGLNNYENTFQVELDNKYYTLSFNNDENTYEVAERFLRKYGLKDEFKDEIVDFIKKNFVSAGKLRIHDSINTEGIKAILNRITEETRHEYPCIARCIENVSPEDSEDLERELKCLMKEGPMFMALDLIRYFSVHGCAFDMSFLFMLMPRDKKEAVTFVRLVTNLFVHPPFNLEVLHGKVLMLRDRGLVEENVLDDYFTNRSMKSRK
ncbi:putative PFU protein [Ordospora pajunii]|uniref:putative PFU protein n=1 Tax=Ordospora pajunii TaxID=3039483 RepID=UPI0029526786|nr:putative PFU protein [Ordospora pajunii]KAH9410746.1 putative PFU protein [Ordospora pajunii]